MIESYSYNKYYFCRIKFLLFLYIDFGLQGVYEINADLSFSGLGRAKIKDMLSVLKQFFNRDTITEVRTANSLQCTVVIC